MIEAFREPHLQRITFRIVISESDMRRAKLDLFDRALIEECSKPGTSAADVLLGLETIVRRIEEYHAQEEAKQAREIEAANTESKDQSNE